MDRVQRLILSKLPSLGGNFPMTSTLCLRLMNLLEGSNYAEVATRAIQSLLKLPHVSFGSDTSRHQLLHHVRFSFDYLRRAGLLDPQGKPMNLFGIAAHLYYTEPSNFALVALARSGVLHRICGQPSLITAKRDLVLLLAHLFGRKHLPSAYTSKSNLAAITRKSPSMVLLPPLQEAARKVLVEHDKEILHVFTGYAITYASQYRDQLGRDCRLPLSDEDFSGNNVDEDSLFRIHLRQTSIPVVARSPFVATSGHGDEFSSVDELTRTARSGLHLTEHAIPSLSHITAMPSSSSKKSDDKTNNNNAFGLNAYLLDFYTHGQVAALAAANGIRRGDVWYLLQDFMLTLMTIRGGLEQLLLKASKEGSVDGDEEGEGDAEGYDPSEMDEGDGKAGEGEFKRPNGVSDKDWRYVGRLVGLLWN
jgi:ATP-dependent RNA helicase DDX60